MLLQILLTFESMVEISREVKEAPSTAYYGVYFTTCYRAANIFSNKNTPSALFVPLSVPGL